MSALKGHTMVAMLLIATVTTPRGEAAENGNLPPKQEFYVYLLMGQSNMAGRGKMTEADRRPVRRVWMLNKEGQWVPAAHPLHFDKPTIAGVGLGMSFAQRMCEEDPSIQIGLIPCAFGGTPLSRWSKGGDLYENAVARAKIAMQDGTLKGVLWHQGESDSGKAETADTYADRLAKMIQDLRGDLDAPKLPFVAGRLGEFFLERKDFPLGPKVDAALADLPKHVELTACASAKGLAPKSDRVHFNADALREFGRRYAEEMIRLIPRVP